jgi:hypothetical protein
LKRYLKKIIYILRSFENFNDIIINLKFQPEPLRNLAELVTAQLAFYKEAHETLAELAPEIDEMQVQQETLYR